MAVADVRFVKDLYPRLREDDAAVERYRASIDRLPPITVARDGVLVDGYHRLLAHRREGVETVTVENLGDLADIEIMKESLRRNSSHGMQLVTTDKRRNADRLYRGGLTDYGEIADLLSITVSTAETYCRDARRDEKKDQQAQAWDLWLDCWTQQKIADRIGVAQGAVSKWLSDFGSIRNLIEPPESRQHFDVWSFHAAAGNSSYFGKMPPQIVENLLWLYTEPGQIVFDPFAGGGTTIEVSKQMGRRVWASDLAPSTETLPIHTHDILDGWPADAPSKVDFVLLDPPYFTQANGRYPTGPHQIGDYTSLNDFMDAWQTVIETIRPHLTGHMAFIIGPTEQKQDGVIDHAYQMYAACLASGYTPTRRIIATYNTQQATGQQVEWARSNRKLLKLYRDVVVMT